MLLKRLGTPPAIFHGCLAICSVDLVTPLSRIQAYFLHNLYNEAKDNNLQPASSPALSAMPSSPKQRLQRRACNSFLDNTDISYDERDNPHPVPLLHSISSTNKDTGIQPACSRIDTTGSSVTQCL